MLEIIQRELAVYQAGQATSLPASVPYREFIAHTQHLAREFDAQAFFTDMLIGIDEPTTPFDLIDINGDGTRIVELLADVDDALSTQIRSISKSLKVSPATLFHTCWAMVVSACSGRDDVVFGTVMSGRLQGTEGAENMLGVFINTLPVRVQLDAIDVLSVIQQVHTSLMDLLPFEQTPLALAQNCSSVLGDAPLFSALLNYRHSAVPSDVAGDSVEQDDGVKLISGQERTNYPFNLFVNDWGDGFSMHVQVDKAISAERVLEYVQTALASLVQALLSTPGQQLKSLLVLPEQERLQLSVGREALHERDMADQQQVFVAPRTETERILCAIWQEVLDVEQVGIHDNFFHLGGHSLLIMRVIARAQQEEVYLAARQLFTHPTPSSLAAEVEASNTALRTAPSNLNPAKQDQTAV